MPGLEFEHLRASSLASKPSINGDAAIVAGNLRRIMARDDLTFDQVVEATELDERTLRALARGTSHPHARTLHKLAHGLGVSIDELFRLAGRAAPRKFDRATNSLVESCVTGHAELFSNWAESDFDELYSRFGTGGQLTEEGILAAARATNAKRDLWRQVIVILESSEAELLSRFVTVLYGRVTSTAPSPDAGPVDRARVLSRRPANHGDRIV
jgi:transcriptional regulator with XRE-family HTH domain